MIIDIENTGGGLIVSHYTEEGEVNMLKIPVPKALQFVWQKTQDYDKAKDKESKMQSAKSRVVHNIVVEKTDSTQNYLWTYTQVD